MKVLIKILFLSSIIILLNCNCADINQNEIDIDSLAIKRNREALTVEMKYLVENAQNYTRKPKALGGGGNSFYGWTIPDSLKQNAHGQFISNIVNKDSLQLFGLGIIIGNDRKSLIQMAMDVSRRLGISSTRIIN